MEKVNIQKKFFFDLPAQKRGFNWLKVRIQLKNSQYKIFEFLALVK